MILTPKNERRATEEETPTVYRTARTTAQSDLRLHANEGAPPLAELTTTLGSLSSDLLSVYPSARRLEARIASAQRIEPSQVLVTAGAGDAIDRAFRSSLGAGRDLVVPTPTFELFYSLAATTGAKIRKVPWGDRFPEEAVRDETLAGAGLLALVTPNNPTGATIPVDILERLLAAVSPTPVLIDLLYVEYADEDPTDRILEFENALVVRSFSKAWGMAGCRVGYVLGSPAKITTLRAFGPPYPVSGLSLELVERRLDLAKSGSRTDDAMENHVGVVRKERESLRRLLTSCGVPVGESQSNFLLGDFGRRAELIHGSLASRGVHVRSFPWREGLEPTLRISLPGAEDAFKRLVDALSESLAPDALLFDMDGVLADVRLSYDRATLETLSRFGLDLSPSELAAARRAGNANNDWVVVQRLLAESGRTVPLDDVISIFQEMLLGRGSRAGFCEAELPTVDPARLSAFAADRRLGIVTGRPRAEAVRFLERFGLADLFGVVVAQEDAPQKPDPAPIQLALRRLGARTALFVGDTTDDMKAAKAAGIIPVGVIAPGEDPKLARSALTEAGAVTVFSTTVELLEVLS